VRTMCDKKQGKRLVTERACRQVQIEKRGTKGEEVHKKKKFACGYEKKCEGGNPERWEWKEKKQARGCSWEIQGTCSVNVFGWSKFIPQKKVQHQADRQIEPGSDSRGMVTGKKDTLKNICGGVAKTNDATCTGGGGGKIQPEKNTNGKKKKVTNKWNLIGWGNCRMLTTKKTKTSQWTGGTIASKGVKGTWPPSPEAEVPVSFLGKEEVARPQKKRGSNGNMRVSGGNSSKK